MASISIQCLEPHDDVSLYTHGYGLIVAFVLIVLTDLPLRAIFKDMKTRWFALHFLVNMFITACCLRDLLGVMHSPLCVMLEPTSSWQPSCNGRTEPRLCRLLLLLSAALAAGCCFFSFPLPLILLRLCCRGPTLQILHSRCTFTTSRASLRRCAWRTSCITCSLPAASAASTFL